jgi:hypothetical protein
MKEVEYVADVDETAHEYRVAVKNAEVVEPPSVAEKKPAVPRESARLEELSEVILGRCAPWRTSSDSE